MPRIAPEELAARRQHIVEAARRCLARDGATGLTTRAVVAEAGISTGALYHHFADLGALRAELAEQEVVAGITAVAARALAGEDPLAWAVRALVCAPPLGVARRDRAPASTGAERVVRATLDEVLRAADAAGTVRSDIDHEALAELLELVWDGIDRRWATGVRTSSERLAAALGSLIEAGVRPSTNG